MEILYKGKAVEPIKKVRSDDSYLRLTIEDVIVLRINKILISGFYRLLRTKSHMTSRANRAKFRNATTAVIWMALL